MPRLRKHFEAAEATTGIDWRLIASVAYHESHWDPNATSYTSVRGIMMLTEETAALLAIPSDDKAQLQVQLQTILDSVAVSASESAAKTAGTSEPMIDARTDAELRIGTANERIAQARAVLRTKDETKVARALTLLTAAGDALSTAQGHLKDGNYVLAEATARHQLEVTVAKGHGDRLVHLRHPLQQLAGGGDDLRAGELVADAEVLAQAEAQVVGDAIDTTASPALLAEAQVPVEAVEAGHAGLLDNRCPGHRQWGA